jgi:hypothetical protein
MAQRRHRVEIIVAVIGAVAMIAAAVITTRNSRDPVASGVALPLSETGILERFDLKFSVNLQGEDYDNFDLALDDHELCAAACAESAKCRSFVYTPRGHEGARARCWLKTGVPAESSVPGFISGVKKR